jgi:hypothetical protein
MKTKEHPPSIYWKSIIAQQQRKMLVEKYYHPWINMVTNHLIDEWYEACEDILPVTPTKDESK